MDTPFRSVRDYPEREDANGVVLRLIDGIGYRFYWATQDLAEDDYGFSPGHECFTIGHLIGHVWELANFVRAAIVEDGEAQDSFSRPEEAREQVFEMLAEVRARIEGMAREELFALTIRDMPFWHFINGPLSDALTHIGQIASFRRLNGNPVPRHSVFLCREKAQ